YRVEHGEKVAPEAFAARFPAFKTSLCNLLTAHRFASRNDMVGQPGPVSFPPPRSIFLGFNLQRELGRGAFARVYLARETALGNREVVVKVSPQGEGAIEADILGQLNHENIVPIHSMQRDSQTGLTALCMPFLGRATLCDLLDQAFLEPGYPASAR